MLDNILIILLIFLFLMISDDNKEEMIKMERELICKLIPAYPNP